MKNIKWTLVSINTAAYNKNKRLLLTLKSPRNSTQMLCTPIFYVFILRAPIRPSNLQMSNKPVFNAFVLNQSQTPKPKSTIEKNKGSTSAFTLASNNILSSYLYKIFLTSVETVTIPTITLTSRTYKFRVPRTKIPTTRSILPILR